MALRTEAEWSVKNKIIPLTNPKTCFEGCGALILFSGTQQGLAIFSTAGGFWLPFVRTKGKRCSVQHWSFIQAPEKSGLILNRIRNSCLVDWIFVFNG